MITKRRKKKNRNWDEIISIGLLLILNLVIISFLFVGNWKLYQRRASLKKDVIDLEKEVALLREREEQLKKLFFKASQKEYLEKIIREKGLYKKPGEEVAVIIKEKKETPPPPPLPEEANLQKIIKFFRNLFGK
ncbi:MAG: septum formation initiator family protein [Candidatus Pacebacteria bacterium]|nr:septum formation initiator family protein [Candidatus Paceibacterota bacterium]